MFCSQCGTDLAANSIFCFKCGKQIQEQSLIAEPSLDDSILPQSGSLDPAPQPPKPAGLTKRQNVTLAFWALLLISIFSVEVLIPAFYGEKYDIAKKGGTLMFGTGWAFWYFWKVRNRKGWVGGVVGVAVSILVLFLGAAIGGYVRGQPEYVLENTPPYPSIKEHFPKEYESMRHELVAAAKEKKLTTEDFISLLSNKMIPLVNQSLKTTSDPAMLLFGKAKLSMFHDVAKSNPNDCYGLISGTIANGDLKTASKSFSPETSALNEQAMQKVFEDTGTYRQAMDSPRSEARSKTLFTQLDAILTRKYSLSAYDLFDDSHNMPADVRCKAGIALFEEIMNLPSDDSAFMLRVFFAH